MILDKIYSEPKWLFEDIEFKKGINFIFARKIPSEDKKNSLNGLGKSLLLNLIDFCLLSSETVHIKSAKKNNDLLGYSIVLEFTIDDKHFLLKRPFDKPNKGIIFGEIWSTMNSYENTPKNKELTRILCELIYKDETYKWRFLTSWLRTLTPFFIKSQASKSKINFADPIKYIPNTGEIELIPAHLYLMNIDNTLFYKNYHLVTELKNRNTAFLEVNRLVTETYWLPNVKQAENEMDRLQWLIEKDEKNISNFRLADQYSNIEGELNTLTAEIKETKFSNIIASKRIQEYIQSYEITDSINIEKIVDIYKEVNKLFAQNIKKSLTEALDFRKSLATSRMEFLEAEINELRNRVIQGNLIIQQLEDKRATLFEFLSAKEAIQDLSEAYLNLSKRRSTLSDIKSKISVSQDLRQEIANLDAEKARIVAEIVSFINSITEKISDLRKIFFEVHDSIYPENNEKDGVGFSITENSHKQSKVSIDIKISKDLANGKNKIRTLIYDLMILFFRISKNLHWPKFLIHDGIFDWVDKSQFICLYEYLQSKTESWVNFQYIVTINEEWELNGNFWNSDKVTAKRIAEEAIIVLDYEHPLFWKHWD